MKACGESVPGYKLREMVEAVDKDKNGTVEFDEFIKVRITNTGSLIRPKHIRQIFFIYLNMVY